jgi:hypothetical protein
MGCEGVREQLSRLGDGERAAARWGAVAVVKHCLGCAGCRAAWRRLRLLRRAARSLPAPPPPGGLRERVLASLPAAGDWPLGEGTFRRIPGRVRLARSAVVGAALVLALLLLAPWGGRRSTAAEIEAAIRRANTWHLRGWKLRDGQRVRWEIWGRRSPYLYREQVGEELNFDDGRQLVRVLSPAKDGSRFAVRVGSTREAGENWRELMTGGIGWQRSKPWRETPDALIFRWHDSGMQGPDTQADSCYTVDRRSWLPVLYEYRRDTNRQEWVAESLTPEYDVPLPLSVTMLRLPPKTRLVDALSGARGSVPLENTQQAHGLTLQIAPLAMDADGVVLARARCWLGNLMLGSENSRSWCSIGAPERFSFVGHTRDTAFHADDGQAYVDCTPHEYNVLRGGDQLISFAPLEPRPAGAPLPRALDVQLSLEPAFQGQGSNLSDQVAAFLFTQEFHWRLPLPERTAPIRIKDFLPADFSQRVQLSEEVPFPVRIAQARARGYETLGDLPRAIGWLEQGIAGLPPASNYAQFLRLELANYLRNARNLEGSRAVLREVIAESERHPETWDYYRKQAEAMLREPPPRARPPGR